MDLAIEKGNWEDRKGRFWRVVWIRGKYERKFRCLRERVVEDVREWRRNETLNTVLPTVPSKAFFISQFLML